MKLLNSILVLALIAALPACDAVKSWLPFNKDAALAAKWDRISSWVPADSQYLAVLDINKFAVTPFYKEVFGGDLGRNLQFLKGIGADTEGGIAVFASEVMFIGGQFNPAKEIVKIKELLAKEKTVLSEQKYRDEIIYIDSVNKSAFVFLKRFLLCEGGVDAIKKIIDVHASGKNVPPKVDASHILTGYYVKNTKVKFFADVLETLKFVASAEFPSPEDAIKFADEAQGIKAIKSIQEMDTPWLADLVANVNITRTEGIVKISTELSQTDAKRLLKRALK